MSEASSLMLVCFVEVIKATDFCTHFNISRVRVKQVWKRIVASDTILPKKIAELIWVKPSARLKSLKLSMIASYLDLNPQKIKTEQVRQILRAFIAVVTYAEKGSRMHELFYAHFRAKLGSVALMNRGQFLQSVFSSTRRGTLALLDFTTRSVLKVQMFLTL